MVNSMLPSIKEKVTSFLTNEDGKITKQSLLSIGAIIGAATFGSLLSEQVLAAHTNTLGMGYSSSTLRTHHLHHASHSSHSNHGTHSTHSTHTSHSTGGGGGGYCKCVGFIMGR